jgi:23S rRNA (uridine2552-2'-O)-methyltransferase
MKYFSHPSMDTLKRNVLVPSFRRVVIAKPPSSRKESAENYFLCRGFNGFSDAASTLRPIVTV